MAAKPLINTLKSVNRSNVYDISKTDIIIDFNGGGNALKAGKWKVYNASGTAANAPYSGACGGYVDIVTGGDVGVTGTKVYQTFSDDYGDVYYKIIVIGTSYGTWKKLS
ncbi:hypothetical protein D3C81_2056630 [compost metagenome]